VGVQEWAIVWSKRSRGPMEIAAVKGDEDGRFLAGSVYAAEKSAEVPCQRDESDA